MQLFLLFQSASGYSLFQRIEYQQIAGNLFEIQKSVQQFGRFKKLVKLFAFEPFKQSGQGIKNIEALNNGKITDDLKSFLTSFLPKKSKKYLLGIGDIRLGSVINQELGINLKHDEVTSQLLRGIRLHFPRFLKGDITQEQLDIQQLGLGHTYSRSRVKHDVGRHDKSIIQSIALVDLEFIVLLACQGYQYFHYVTERMVQLAFSIIDLIEDRSGANHDNAEKMEQIVKDEGIVSEIIQSAKNSMGQDLALHDHLTIKMFTKRINDLIQYRQQLGDFLRDRVDEVAPNLGSLLGENVSARLISHAGGLRNLAKLPASTIQILGAQKALFRALKQNTNTPKYGLLYNSSFISRAQKKNKGRISRYLSNKCAIASRMDYFSLLPTGAFGDKMKEQVEQRLTFFETGQKPQKNMDAMKSLLAQLRDKGSYKDSPNADANCQQETDEDEKKQAINEDDKQQKQNQKKQNKKKKKKNKKTKAVKADKDQQPTNDANDQAGQPTKKKKKKKSKKSKTA